VTACPKELAETLNRRGIRPLAWSWGSNYLADRDRELRQNSAQMTPDLARQTARSLITATAQSAAQAGLAGLGMDEFGGYAASDFAANTKGFVRGLIDARPDLPKGSLLLAWHGGPIDSELMGLYKEAVEFLVPEAYLLDFVPSQLGTDLAVPDLAGRLADARANDMFTAPYGSRCRVVPAVDVTDKVPVGEYEAFVRMLRREFPEVRGISFFNVLSQPNWERYRVIDRLCFDYFIRPVLTFEPDGLYLDRFGSGRITAWLSNLGAIDSRPVKLRLLVNGREASRATVAGVPAGFSRVDNRAAATFSWQPRVSGTYRLRVEVTDPGEATVLEPAAEVSVYLRAQGVRQG
jgi:hypothetical protein